VYLFIILRNGGEVWFNGDITGELQVNDEIQYYDSGSDRGVRSNITNSTYDGGYTKIQINTYPGNFYGGGRVFLTNLTRSSNYGIANFIGGGQGYY